MPNARTKRRGRPPKIQNNNNTKYLNNKAEKFYEEEEEEEEDDDDSNQSSIVSDNSSPKYRTRTRRSSRRASKLSVTIEHKKRGRKRKKYASEDEFVDEEYEEPVAQSDDENPESEIEDDDDDDDVDENVDDLMDDEEADDDVEDGDDSKRRPVREKAQLFLDDKELPELVLPSSSEDLLISQRELIRALSVYEILKHFSVTLRLTPFRFEDFAVSLLIDEQTYLLSEVHLTLLKALIREDDLVGTQHGPQDVRDSINIYLYLCDHVTWPEVLRIYLSSVSKDETKNLNMIKDCMDCGYPFTSLDKKLTLLEYLCDEFLNTQRAREFLNLEGKIEHDEHCRACQKNGEMLMCDTCPAVFHLGCLDPPLKQVPESEWFCPICKQNQVNGVTDCVNDFEKQMPRQEPIGWDRHGRQYWFLSRRIIVEDCKSDNVWYYTTRLQFDELLNILDADHYEKELHNTLTELKDEIYKQMAITEKLTKTAKGSRKSYLEIVNEELYLRIKSEQSKNDPNGIDEKQAELDSKLAVDEDDLRNGFNGSGGVQTRLKTGTLQQKPIALDPFKNRVNIYNTINTFREDDSVIIMEDDQKSLTRISRKLLPSNYNTTILFKLGFEGNYRNYQNIYSLNPHALSRDQLLDDRDKKRHLGHKFSLTSASELKWASYTNISTESIANNPNGTQVNLINTIRQALLFLETNLSQPFMHPFWKKYRDKWTKAVSLCLDGNSFGLALAILESCMKPVLFNNAWRDSLGFTVLKRTTQAERDELKKKDNKKGRDNPETVVFDDASTSKFNITLGTGIKLINGKLRHQIWKQKGEEYRLSGVGGWLWLNTLCDPIKPDQSKVEKDLSVENEDQPEKVKDDDDDDSIVEEDIIDISEALQSRTSNQRKKLYPKLFNESKLDRFLQKRLDMIEFERKTKKPSPAITDTNPDACQKPKHNCYSPSCDRETQSKCYSALCQLDYKQRLALENSKKKDLTESVDLQQIIVENGTEQFAKKVVTYMAKGQLPPSGRFSNRKHRTIFIPLPYELRRLGRCGGNCEVDGFNYNAKINNSIWPYGLTPRPNFRTAWLFRTDNMTTLHCVALQLRVLWASIRWDDLAQQPLASGINTITTENEVQTIEIMKRRDLPPFGLASEYLVRKIIVPIDLPVRTREVSTPNRSGLRERRRPESPQNKGPRMTEKWVNEKELQLWEIQQFNDKQIQLAKQRAAQEQRQLEIKKRLEMNKQHAMNDMVKINGNHVNRNNVVRLNSMIQNRSKILTSANVISPSTSQAIPFHTIHTSNGQAIKLHTVGTTATGNKLATGTQYIIRGNQLVAASNPNTVSLLNVATTTNLSSANRNTTTTAYLVKSPNMIGPTTNNTARLSIIPSALNGPILRPVNAISSSNKQSFPFITTNGPKKISTINTIFTPNTLKPVNSTSITTATTVTNSNPIITAVNLANATPTKNIHCVPVKLADGRTTLVPLSSLAGGNIQLSLNNQPIRVVAKPATTIDNSQSDNSGASKTVLINSNSMISPLNTLILPNNQKVYLQPANSVVKPMAITTNSNTLSQSLTNSPRTVIFKTVTPNPNTVVENKSQQTDPISKLQLQPSTIPVTSSVDSNISGIGGNNVEKKDFVVTSEMTQEVVRKALMNANPPEIQQKLIALQRHHLEQTDVSYKPYQVNQSIKKDYQPPPFSVHRHSSRSSRYSKSRYDHEDYIYDFPQSERMGRYNPDRNNCENDVKKICQSIIKQIVDKIDKEEKRKRHEEILMERRHKKAIQMKLKYRQNHIEAIRLNIMRRKSLLNQNIRNSVNRKILEELTKAKRSALKESKFNTTTISDDESIGQTSWSANLSSTVEPKPKIVEQVVMPVEPNKIKKVGRPRKNPIIPKASPPVQSQSSPIVLTKANNLEQSVIQEENQPKIIDNIDNNKNNDVCEQNHLTVKEIGAATEEKKEVKLCFCEHPDRDAMMIQCDNCERWLHVECVNIEATEIEFIDKYFCPDCEPSKGSSTRKSSLDPMADQSKENTSTSLSLTPDSVAPKNRKRKSPSTSSSSSTVANKKARMTKKEDQKKKRGRKPKQEKSAPQPNENDGTNDPGCFCGRSPQWEEQIGCDKCNKWYHAPCIGLTWFRFPDIDPYFCPECQGPETANGKNFQLISNQEEAYAKMNEVFKLVKNHPLVGTWLKSQTEEENPHYIREIYHPMDFEMIEDSLKQKKYNQICEFVHNVYQTFDNCRYYHGVGSDECKKVLKIDKDWDKILEDHGLKDSDLHAIDHDKLMQQQLKAEAEGIIRKEWLEKKKNQYLT